MIACYISYIIFVECVLLNNSKDGVSYKAK